MPEIFTVRIDLGADAPVAMVAQSIVDLHTLTDVAAELTGPAAAGQARRYLSDVVANEGLHSLLSRVRRHELPFAEQFEAQVDRLDAIGEDYERYLREFGPPGPRRRYLRDSVYSALLGSSATGVPWNWSIEGGMQAMLRQLEAAETASRLPASGYRMRSLQYANPVTAELIAEVGISAAALAYILRVITTLRPRRRRETARASAEERIQNANARDAEDLVATRIELRRILRPHRPWRVGPPAGGHHRLPAEPHRGCCGPPRRQGTGLRSALHHERGMT